MGFLRPKVAQPTRKKVVPKRKMKALHWKRIIIPRSDEDAETIWSGLDDVDELDLEQFEEEFGAKTARKMRHRRGESIGQVSESGVVRRAGPVSLLDEKRSRSIAIMLSQLPKGDRLLDALRLMDESALPPEKMNMLRSNLPTEKEIELIRNAVETDESVRLDKPEQFFLTLSEVPCLELRLNCWWFAAEFDERVQEVMGGCKVLIDACRDLKTSTHLHYLFRLILTMGNYMNGGSNRGQADGFKLAILPRLSSTKNMANNKTLLHYVALYAARRFDDVHKLNIILRSIYHAADGVSLTEIESRAKKLQMEVKRTEVQASTVAHRPFGGDKDGFSAFIDKVMTKATKEMEQVDALLKKAQSLFMQAVEFFGDGGKVTKLPKTPSNEFFGQFKTFVDELLHVLPSQADLDAPSSAHSAGRKHDVGQKIQGGMAAVVAEMRRGKKRRG